MSFRGWPAVLTSAALITCTAFACDPVTSSPVSAPRANASPFETVAHAVDGDTVKLTDGRTIRVLAIDTPETKDPRKPVQCGGPEASAFAHATLDGQHVRVQADPSQDATDKYGRTLAYLMLPDGRNYSVMVAKAGWAHAYAYRKAHPPLAYYNVRAAENQAAEARIGIWGQCGGKP